ncbi:hypothetical protein ONS96_005655 [Cadophora gregata f. sp. sojae]|nr:hypothetical protein ONS96_005655 [Cadophora gregata f. sp. sojae]
MILHMGSVHACDIRPSGLCLFVSFTPGFRGSAYMLRDISFVLICSIAFRNGLFHGEHAITLPPHTSFLVEPDEYASLAGPESIPPLSLRYIYFRFSVYEHSSSPAIIMPPRKITTKSSRITKSKTQTRPSLPRAAKSKSPYQTVAVPEKIEEETEDEDGNLPIPRSGNNEKSIKPKDIEHPSISLLLQITQEPLKLLITNTPTLDVSSIPRTKSPVATRILQEEENITAKADAVWAIHRNHTLTHSPCSSPLRQCYSPFPPCRRSSGSSLERIPGPPLADLRLSPTSHRRLLTSKAKFVARWEADGVAKANNIKLEEYTVLKNRPGVKVGVDGEEEDKDVERWRPEKPVFESFIGEEDIKIWREDEVAQRQGVSLFDCRRPVQTVGSGRKGPRNDTSKDFEKEIQRSDFGGRPRGRTESRDSSNSGGSLFCGQSPNTPGALKETQRGPEYAGRSSVSEAAETKVTVQTREHDVDSPTFATYLCLGTEESAVLEFKTQLTDSKSLCDDGILCSSSAPSPPDLSDWTSHLFTREELATMIDLSVNNVHIDCPHCDLIIRQGLPLPLPFLLRERCVCTFPQMMAKEYRGKEKEGEGEGEVALKEEVERAVRKKMALIGEVADRSMEQGNCW